jgi:hypothetical protein
LPSDPIFPALLFCLRRVGEIRGPAQIAIRRAPHKPPVAVFVAVRRQNTKMTPPAPHKQKQRPIAPLTTASMCLVLRRLKGMGTLPWSYAWKIGYAPRLKATGRSMRMICFAPTAMRRCRRLPRSLAMCAPADTEVFMAYVRQHRAHWSQDAFVRLQRPSAGHA